MFSELFKQSGKKLLNWCKIKQLNLVVFQFYTVYEKVFYFSFWNDVMNISGCNSILTSSHRDDKSWWRLFNSSTHKKYVSQLIHLHFVSSHRQELDLNIEIFIVTRAFRNFISNRHDNLPTFVLHVICVKVK